MYTGAEEFKRLFETFGDRPILLYGDPDVDGLISLLLMCQFCDSMGKKYSYYVNSKRGHGFFIDPQTIEGYLVISSDFGIDSEEIKNIVEHNIVLLATDHHSCQDEFIHYHCEDKGTEGILINNQYPFEPEEDRYQSGAGVLYEMICSIYPDFKSPVREALVGITLLSDSRPIENEKAKAYLRQTYSIETKGNYLGYLLETALDDVDFGFGVPRLDRNFIDFTLSPLINSLLRFDLEWKAVEYIMGRGISTEDKKLKRLQSKLVADMKSCANYLEFPNIRFVGVSTSELNQKYPNVDMNNFVGLMCNSIKGTGKSVLGFAYDSNGVITRASFRGEYDDIDYRSSLQEIGLQAEGHAGAFGILNFVPDREVWGTINTIVGELNKGHQQSVTILNASNLSFILMQKGFDLATGNCYVRDMYRTYLKYTGNGHKIVKETFKTEPFTDKDLSSGAKPDKYEGGLPVKYTRDVNNNMVRKYIEYSVDGKSVKSFGITLEEGLILPILERGHVKLYVREAVN